MNNVHLLICGHSQIAVRRIQSSEQYMDRVNMYASFYVAVRSNEPSPMRVPTVSIENIDDSGKDQTKLPGSPDSVLIRTPSEKSL
jgi:hypothetical protein